LHLPDPRPHIAVALEAELQRKLRNARIAKCRVVLSEGIIELESIWIGRAGWLKCHGCVGQIKVWMIEKIEEVRTKLKAVLVFEGESLRHEEVPLLLEGPTDLRDVAAKVAKDSTHMGAGPGPANGERLISGTTKGV